MCSSIYSMDCVCLAARHQMNGFRERALRARHGPSNGMYQVLLITIVSTFIRESLIPSQSLDHRPKTEEEKCFTSRERATIDGSGDRGLFSSPVAGMNHNRFRSVREHDLAFIRLADIEDHCQTRIARTIAFTYRRGRAKITTVACASYSILFASKLKLREKWRKRRGKKRKEKIPLILV